VEVTSHINYTKNDIDLPISEEIECVLSSDTAVGISKALGLAVISFSEAFKRIAPDLVVVLGDRWEILGCAIAAHFARIPIAHIHGGEVTQGSYDDSWRHSISHMAQLHFPAAEVYRSRLIQIGQQPDTVFNVGALGCDGLKRRDSEFEGYGYVLALHSTTTDYEDYSDTIGILSEDCEPIYLAQHGNDVGYKKLPKHNEWDTYQIKSGSRLEYLDFLRGSRAIVGNSSSAVIEAPTLGVPSILIGNRQQGRLMADSIIKCEANSESIKEAINTLYSPEFESLMKSDYQVFYKGSNVAEKILKIIKQKMPVGIKKEFYDLATT
jgi:GDP/UDP-N,N'-diacetylbacillosamine 2-epimerase (hydrolysing)